MKKPSLRLRDWYFLDCPANELAACCYYEYARYSPAIIDAVRCLDGGTRDWMGWYPEVSFAAVLMEKFPNTPWLDLPATRRKEFVSRCPAPAAQLNLVITNPPHVVYRPPAFPGRGPCILNSPDETIVAIKVRWRYSDDQLKAAFQRFLKAHRPVEKKTPRGRKASYQDYLNALGAKRLLQHCTLMKERSAAGAAMKIIEESRASIEEVKAKIYSNQSALTNAAEKVDGVLQLLYLFGNEKAHQPGVQHALAYWLPEVDPPI